MMSSVVDRRQRLGLPYVLMTASCVLVVGCTAPEESTENQSALAMGPEVRVSQAAIALIVLEGATLIDGNGTNPLENSAIVLEGDRIVRVGQIGDFDYPEDASVTDLSGRFIVSGFINTHAHMFETFPQPLLAFGITTVRNPSTSGSLGIELRDRLNTGELVGPRMLTAGLGIENSDAFSVVPDDDNLDDAGVGTNYVEVRTASDVRAEVQRQAAGGYDAIKVYMGIEPPLVEAAVDEAHSLDLAVIGHLKTTSWTTAARSGIDVLVHSCSEGASWELLELPEREEHDWSTWPNSLRSWAATADTIGLEGPRWEALIDALVSNGTEVNPTLVTMEALYWADDSAHLAQEQPAFAPEGYAARWQAQWEAQRNFMESLGFSKADFDAFKSAFSACKQMIGAMHTRGVF